MLFFRFCDTIEKKEVDVLRILTKKETIPNEFISASRKTFRKSVDAHGHDFFEIELIIRGSGTYVIDGKTYPIQPRTLFLLNPAQIHSVDADMELFNVMFQCEYDGDFFAFPLTGNGTSPMFCLDEEEYQLMYSLLTELVKVHKEDCRFGMLLLRCVLRKLINCIPTHAAENHSPYIQQTILYMLENFRSGITLESAAAHLGLSKAYLSDCFSKQLGVNFKTYLDNIRFSYAQNLLAFTEIPIGEIHERAGFYDYANFARRFKQKYGCSPGEYRKKRARE